MSSSRSTAQFILKGSAETAHEIFRLTLGAIKTDCFEMEVPASTVGNLFRLLYCETVQQFVFPDHDMSQAFFEEIDRLLDRWNIRSEGGAVKGRGVEVTIEEFVNRLTRLANNRQPKTKCPTSTENNHQS